MYQKFFLSVSATIIAAITTFCAPLAAQERTSRHTLGSGPDIYRVEIRNLHRLQVLGTGDSDGVGELHDLTITLRAFDRVAAGAQTDRLSYSGTLLYLINKGGIVGGDRYFPIRNGQHVFTSQDRQENAVTQMWIHVNTAPEATNRIWLEVNAQELDCVGQRVCRRRGVGGTSIEFSIPEFTRRPSNRCGPDNTFRLEPLDGQIQISGLSDSTVFEWQFGTRSVLSSKSSESGPRLIPFNADICIASTIRT